MIERATEPMMYPAARVSSPLEGLEAFLGFWRWTLKPDIWDNWELEDLCEEDFWELRELACEKTWEAKSNSTDLRILAGFEQVDI